MAPSRRDTITRPARRSDETHHVLDVGKDFNMLSLTDLLAARDLYHLHLMAKQNVIGTAVGRYLIRTSDEWPRGHQDLVQHDTRDVARTRKEPRTLANSEVRPYSWPCLLVFVDTWADEADTSAGLLPAADLVPKALLMPDGSRVPVCIVYAPIQEAASDLAVPQHFPAQRIGGGYPILLDVQGEEHLASVACLVTDGHLTYALTNRHVTGEGREPVYTILGGEKRRIGVTAGKQLARKHFAEMYHGWPGTNVYVNLDVGLVEIEDRHQWTAAIYGSGVLGKPADLSTANISLRLIDCPMKAYGAASGPLSGTVKALFYRYKSVGGFEYVADCLIGPRESRALGTKPGDSGTMWMLETGDEKAGNMPVALQWGAQRFLTDGRSMESPFVLATFLSTICRELDVDVLRDLNIGGLDYWGAVGHYTIGALACEKVTVDKVRTLMLNNVTRISFAADQITKENTQGLSKHDFVPLADVPDLVWKLAPRDAGGRGQPEHPGHFADMDAPDSNGQTLLDICRTEPAGISVSRWQQYYTDVKDSSRGLLPFRVWQFFDAMVEAVRARNVAEYVCAAGTMAHYVGDACQPLHISYMHDGDPADTHMALVYDRTARQKVEKEVPRASGVHSAYENTMVEYNVSAIIEGIRSSRARVPKSVGTGQEAAQAIVGLMERTFEAIRPADIVKAYQAQLDAGAGPKAAAMALWDAFGEATVRNMDDGCRTLALLWQSAWEAGGGDRIGEAQLAAIDEDTLGAIYRNHEFVPSVTLDNVGQYLRGGGAFDASGDGAAPQRRRSIATTDGSAASVRRNAKRAKRARVVAARQGRGTKQKR